MRIGVIGAGAVGGTLAAVLDRDGHDVEVTARGDHLDAIERSGLRLDGAWGEHTAWLRAGTVLDLEPELAFVTTKAQNAEDAIRDNLRTLPPRVPVVVVQNGLDGLTAARRLLQYSECIGALALFAASHLEPGRVTVTAAASTYLGAPKGEPDELVSRVAEVLGAVIPVETTDNFIGAQWTKLIVNQVNALPAITGLSVQETIADRGLLTVLARSLREAIRVGIAAGVRFAPLQGLDDRRLRVLGSAPLALVKRVPLAMAARMGDVPNPGSTLQSVRRGRATEIDHLNGAIVRAAHRAGREAPVNAALVDLVHEVESTGAAITPDEVVRRVSEVR